MTRWHYGKDGSPNPPVTSKVALLLCNGCSLAEIGTQEWVTFLEAKYGPQGLGPGDIAVLMAPRIQEVRKEKLAAARRRKCERCGATVFCAPSSDWFFELKARLETEKIL